MFISIWQPHTPTHTNVVSKSTKSQWDAFGNHRRWAGCWRAGNWKQSRLIGLISPSGEFPCQMDWRQLAGDFDTVLGMMGKFLISLLCASLSHLSSLHSFSSFCPNQGGAYFSLSFRLWLGNQSDYFIVEQKRRLVRGATVVYCKTCFFLPWCVNEECYTSITYKLSSNWESTQKMRGFFPYRRRNNCFAEEAAVPHKCIAIAFK